VKIIRLVVDIYEAEISEYPVVTHIFNGKSRREAFAYFKAHLTTDEFLRECVRKNRWKTLRCQAHVRWE